MQTLTLLSALAGVVVLYIAWCIKGLLANYEKASKTGFPVYVTVVNPDNILWMLISVLLRPFLARFLPTALYDRVKLAIYGWEYITKYSVQEQLGPTFISTNYATNELWTADPEIAQIILSRRKDFVQLDMTKFVIGRFGQNIITTDGEDWQRQRRLIAPLLGERISNHVWKESSRQAKEMLDCFTKDSTNNPEKIEVGSGKGDTDGTVQGLRDIAINVLLSAGYGLSQPWGNQEAEKAPPGHTQTYIESISYLVNYYMAVAVFPAWFLSLPIMPALLQLIGGAMREFPIHTKEILEKERRSPSSSQTNLMSVLVNASDAEKLHKQTDSKSKLHLSEDELTGNLYQFTIAGFDTTANTLAYAVALLAVYPEWQQWIIDEADQVAIGKADFEYEKTFPALKRCLALMFETMRLYTPVAHISRMNGPYPQTIQTSTGTYIVPPHTKMFVSACSLHMAPNIWGNDALLFRPSRWLLGESFFEPPKGAYLPWSGGPRICPGLKMAQVEFVAVLFTIFKEWEVEVVKRDGETIEEARKRIKKCVDDSQSRITLQMNNPKDVVLRWRRRTR